MICTNEIELNIQADMNCRRNKSRSYFFSLPLFFYQSVFNVAWNETFCDVKCRQ